MPDGSCGKYCATHSVSLLTSRPRHIKRARCVSLDGQKVADARLGPVTVQAAVITLAPAWCATRDLRKTPSILSTRQACEHKRGDSA